MTKVTTLVSVTVTEPVLERGKPVTTKVKFNGREVESEVVDHVRHEANTVIEVEAELAEELIAKRYARPFEPSLDAESETEVSETEGDGEGDGDALS